MSIKELMVASATTVAHNPAPAAAYVTLTIFGVPIATWASILSIVVLLVQLGFLLYNNLKKGRNTDGLAD